MPKIALVVAVGALALAGVGVALTLDDDSEPTSDSRRLESAGLGVSIDVPSGWAVNDRLPLDDLNTTELNVYVGAALINENCSQPTDRTSIRLGIREIGLSSSSDLPPRPHSFGPESNGGFQSGDDAECGERVQETVFTERGRHISVFLTVGRDASERRLAEAYSIANGLRVGRYPWGDFCAVVAQLTAVRTIDARTLRLAEKLAATAPTPETAKDVRRANAVLAGEAAVELSRSSLSHVGSAALLRCGALLPVYLEPLYPGALERANQLARANHWTGRMEIDIATGVVTAPGFNEYVVQHQPTWAATASLAAAEMLRLDQSEAITSVEGMPDGPSRSVVVVTESDLPDDSVKAVEYRLVFEQGNDGLVRFVSGTWSQRCQPNRGHQDLLPTPCA